MPSSPEDIARRTAQRLSGEVGSGLPAAVEAQLHGGQQPERYEPITIAIAVAGLLVSTAKAAWDIYHDVAESKGQKTPAEPAFVRRRLRLTLHVGDDFSPELRDKVIDAVVDEIFDGS